jgi:hypothetical protein
MFFCQPKNQPFDIPRSKARGLLRVDTERRFSPRPKGRGLAPSKYQVVKIIFLNWVRGGIGIS